jgi:hypothetical protein
MHGTTRESTQAATIAQAFRVTAGTMKLKRRPVAEKHAAEIEALYAAS